MCKTATKHTGVIVFPLCIPVIQGDKSTEKQQWWYRLHCQTQALQKLYCISSNLMQAAQNCHVTLLSSGYPHTYLICTTQTDICAEKAFSLAKNVFHISK